MRSILWMLLLFGCGASSWLSFLQSATPLSTTATPECTAQIMPTGERIYPVNFITPLPSQVRAGETHSAEFTGGMAIPTTGLECAGSQIRYLFPNLETAQATTRTIRLSLNDVILHTWQCSYTCTMVFTIPSDTQPGWYEFSLNVLTPDRYPVEVLPAG